MKEFALPSLTFGINIDPSTENLESALRRAQMADASSVDLVTIQDHPYNPDFLIPGRCSPLWQHAPKGCICPPMY